MIATDKNMPSKLNKRRNIYLDDSYWSKLREIANVKKKSISGTLRELILKNL